MWADYYEKYRGTPKFGMSEQDKLEAQARLEGLKNAYLMNALSAKLGSQEKQTGVKEGMELKPDGTYGPTANVSPLITAKTGLETAQTGKTVTETDRQAMNLELMKSALNGTLGGNAPQPAEAPAVASVAPDAAPSPMAAALQAKMPPMAPAAPAAPTPMTPSAAASVTPGAALSVPDYNKIGYVPGKISASGGLEIEKNPLQVKAAESQITNQAALQKEKAAIPLDVQKGQLNAATTEANGAKLMMAKLDQLKNIHEKAVSAPGIDRAVIDPNTPMAAGTRFNQLRQMTELALQGPNNKDWENYDKAKNNFSYMADRGMFGEKGKLIAQQLNAGAKLFPGAKGTKEGDAGLWDILYSTPKQTIDYQNGLVDQYGADPTIKVPGADSSLVTKSGNKYSKVG